MRRLPHAARRNPLLRRLTPPVRITAAASPSDPRVCAFILDHSLTDRSVLCRSADEAAGSPLLERLFAVPGVAQVWVAGNRVTVARQDTPLWTEAAKPLAQAIRAALAEDRPAVSLRPSSPARDLVERVNSVLNADVNPGLAQHGGRAELVAVTNGVAEIRLSGGCQGCGAAKMTLSLGIEQTLRAKVPELLGVKDVTDHAKGDRPYFSGTGRSPFEQDSSPTIPSA